MVKVMKGGPETVVTGPGPVVSGKFPMLSHRQPRASLVDPVVWNSGGMSLKTIMKLFNAAVISVFPYGSATWKGLKEG